MEWKTNLRDHIYICSQNDKHRWVFACRDAFYFNFQTFTPQALSQSCRAHPSMRFPRVRPLIQVLFSTVLSVVKQQQTNQLVYSFEINSFFYKTHRDTPGCRKGFSHIPVWRLLLRASTTTQPLLRQSLNDFKWDVKTSVLFQSVVDSWYEPSEDTDGFWFCFFFFLFPTFCFPRGIVNNHIRICDAYYEIL